MAPIPTIVASTINSQTTHPGAIRRSLAGTSIFIIFLPFLGIFAYLIFNGGKMGECQMRAAKAQEVAVQDYIRATAGGDSSAAEQLSTLADLHTSGKIDDAEYSAAKAKVVS